jgi:hypothetical protein
MTVGIGEIHPKTGWEKGGTGYGKNTVFVGDMAVF